VAYATRIADQAAFMQEHDDCTVLGAAVRLIDPDGLGLGCEHPPLDHGTIVNLLLAGRGDIIRHPVAMFRRQAIAAVGGYRRQFSLTEDLDMFLRLTERGRAANLPQTLLDYRQHLASINRTRWVQQNPQREAVVAEARERRHVAAPAAALAPYRQVSPAEDLLHWGWSACCGGRRLLAVRRGWQAARHGGDKRKALKLACCALYLCPEPVCK
jgi:hypothetical protein